MKKILYCIVSLALLAACKPEPTLEVGKSSLSFGAEGGTESVTVSANYSWTAIPSDGSWIYVQYTEGSETLTIRAGQNRSADARSGSVTVTSEGLSKTISVSQSQLDQLVLKDGDSYELDPSAQQLVIQLSANVTPAATVKEGADWCSVAGTKAMEDHTVTLAVKENTSTADRTASVEIGGGEASAMKVKIVQRGRLQTLSFSLSGQSSFPVPEIKPGEGTAAFAGTIYWPDAAEYRLGTTLTLSPSATTVVRIEGRNAGTVRFTTVKGLDEVDLLGL